MALVDVGSGIMRHSSEKAYISRWSASVDGLFLANIGGRAQPTWLGRARRDADGISG